MKKPHTFYAVIKKLQKFAISIVVLAVFTVPVLLTGKWIFAVVNGAQGAPIIETVEQKPTYTAPKPFEEPLITVTFDDGWESAYTNGLPLFQKYNVRTTHYILGGSFEDPAYMSESQVRSLQKAGHDIAAHTMTHPDLVLLSEADVEWQLAESGRILSSKFGPTPDFATPLSSFDAVTLKHIQAYYRSHRNTFSDTAVIDHLDVNIRGSFDRYNIFAFSITKDTTIDEINRLVQYAKQNNGWLVLNYHQVDDSKTRYSVTPTVLEQHLKFLTEQQVKMPTMREVLDIIVPKEQL